MAEVALLNPYGTDLSIFMPFMLKGYFTGDSVTRIEYDNNATSIENIRRGHDLFDEWVMNTSGPKIAFGHSQGCQIACMWLRETGRSQPVPANELEFLLIGNGARKYGGMIRQEPELANAAYIESYPDNTPYKVTDLTRQYDAFSDFPTNERIRDGLRAGARYLYGGNSAEKPSLKGLLEMITGFIGDKAAMYAIENVLHGGVFTHNWYFGVSPDDEGLVSLQEGNVTYLWEPREILPSLTGWWWLTWVQDYLNSQRRPLIEAMYNRPVDLSPQEPSEEPSEESSESS